MLTIEPTGAVLGATVRGVDLAQSLDERDMGRILLALGRRGVLRFPDQHLDLQGRGDVVSRSDRICPTCIIVTATTPGGMNLGKAGSKWSLCGPLQPELSGRFPHRGTNGLHDSAPEETGFELLVPLATGSLLWRYGNAVGGEEDRKLAGKSWLKNRVATASSCRQRRRPWLRSASSASGGRRRPKRSGPEPRISTMPTPAGFPA